MFASNQIFKVSGDDDEILKDILRIFIKRYKRIQGYAICDYGLVLHEYAKENDTIIPEDDRGNLEYIFNVVKLYLCSSHFRKLKPINGSDEVLTYDGSTHEGWIIELDNRYSYGEIVIRQYVAFYAK